MKIAVLCQKIGFTLEQQKVLSSVGEVIYTTSDEEIPIDQLIKLSAGADILAPDPTNLGGFEKAKPVLTKIMESLPNLKGVCLSTTSFGWVDLDYAKKHTLPVSNIPGYSRESVAEHTLAMMLNLAKKIFISERRTSKGQFKLEMGTELKGKTLGIIGLGNIGSRVAELGKGIGMKVVAYNRTTKEMEGVEMKTLDEVLKETDVLSLHTTHEPANNNMISTKELAKMKSGVLIVNTVDRENVDEKAMAEAIKSGKVGAYAYEAEDLEHTPLAGLENAVGIKAFAWYTKEALQNLYQIWTDNIIALSKNAPRNRVA
jgi:lactate dehydrogenase-like 2-hydroxyacid dehydrogenase